MKSSKKGAKRGKKQQLAAIAAAMQQGNEPLRISGGGSNSPLTVSPNEVPNNPEIQDESNPEISKKKPRGKTKMVNLSKGKAKTSRLIVEFNYSGQPYRGDVAKFASFLGTTARELLPVTLENWKDLSQEFRNQIWEHITVL